MSSELKIALCLSAALVWFGATFAAEPEQRERGPAREERRGEPHPGPQGYERPAEPHVDRPKTFDRGTYQHNFQAARVYRIGPYHRPPGWASHHWVYGERLPRAYWTSQYLIGDYWLFGLEVPPSGYEWVRDGSDALLIDVNSGQILQVEYGVFG